MLVAEEALIAGVELGGTKCVCVLGTPAGGIIKQVRVPTTAPGETLSAIEAVLLAWRDGPGFDRLGIASFGPLDLDRMSVGWGSVLATSKPGWRGAVVGPRLADRIGRPVAMETDVVGAALAEGLWGAARGLSDYAYVTVGTGVGVGVIAGGKPLGGFGHGEWGHIRVGRGAGDTWPGSCPFHGDCVEGLASGPAIAARCGTPSETLPPDHPAWEPVAAALGGLLQTLVLSTTPRLIMMGGGVMAGADHLMAATRRQLEVQLGGYGGVPKGQPLDAYVCQPRLGVSAGPMGALAVALKAN